jgi:hypothetical protein
MIVGLEVDCLSELGDGFVDMSLMKEVSSEVVMSRRESWPQPDRYPEFGDGLVEPTALAQGGRQSIATKRIVGPKPDRLATGGDARVEDLIGFTREAMRP